MRTLFNTLHRPIFIKRYHYSTIIIMSTIENSTSDFDDISMYYVILILLVCVLIMGPCMVFPRQRVICVRRIRQRRWNVATDDIAEPSFLRGEIVRLRYPRDDPRYVATKEDAEKINLESLLEQLKEYTKVRS